MNVPLGLRLLWWGIGASLSLGMVLLLARGFGH